jgi:1-aminocyclopropane-1-carboxylate deaminase/D-cysteine desulfhydrase-like pyridoxal-dependent ACC family enzyme
MLGGGASGTGAGPRKELAITPTPLQEMPQLAAGVGLDRTGLALGGNKARKLEYVVAAAANEGADNKGGTPAVFANPALYWHPD